MIWVAHAAGQWMHRWRISVLCQTFSRRWCRKISHSHMITQHLEIRSKLTINQSNKILLIYHPKMKLTSDMYGQFKWIMSQLNSQISRGKNCYKTSKSIIIFTAVNYCLRIADLVSTFFCSQNCRRLCRREVSLSLWQDRYNGIWTSSSLISQCSLLYGGAYAKQWGFFLEVGPCLMTSKEV